MVQLFQLPSPYVGVNFTPEAWAEQTFGAVDLGDQRRTRRLVELATASLRQPSASLPTQLGSWAKLKAAYRLLASRRVTHTILQAPHLRLTRGVAGAHLVVLFIQDGTTLDYTHHPTVQGLGPVGDGRGRGYLLQSVLAVVPDPRQVLGLAHQEPFIRQPAPPNETRAHRAKRPRESQVWERAAAALGTPPPGSTWVHVGDRDSDIWDFLRTVRAQRADFLIRVAQDRRVDLDDGTVAPLLATLRAQPAQDTRTLTLPATRGRAARPAQLHISWLPTTVRPPWRAPHQPVLDTCWAVRVWESDAPDGVEALEWLLLTSVPVATLAEAWERVDWYRCRWIVEDYHMCLKTGCRIEQRELDTQVGLERLLGVLGLVAVYLLQLRELARLEPTRLAATVAPPDLVAVVATLAGVATATLTVAQCWRLIAQRGGYLGRTGDGPPGWQTIWRGWVYVQTVLEGVRLAPRLPRTDSG